jgi:Tol biopolymer transport system component
MDIHGEELRQVPLEDFGNFGMGTHDLGLAWMADGGDILFSSYQNGLGLFRVSASGGKPQRYSTVQGGKSLTVNRVGDQLALSVPVTVSDLWRIDVPNPLGDSNPTPFSLISSTQWDTAPQVSPDGNRIVFSSSRRGLAGIFMCDSDGNNLERLTSGNRSGSPRWSHDGERIVFDSTVDGQTDIYTVNPELESIHQITNSPSSDVLPSWSHDDRWIYFGSDRSGDQQIWKIPVEGGKPVQVTFNGGFEAFESSDGRFLYFTKRHGISGLWRIPSSGGDEELVSKDILPKLWVLTDRGIFYLAQRVGEKPTTLELFDLETHQVTHIASMEQVINISLPSISAPKSGDWVVFAGGPFGADIMLVENFR